MKIYLVILSLLLLIVCVNFTDAQALFHNWQYGSEEEAETVQAENTATEGDVVPGGSEDVVEEEPPVEEPVERAGKNPGSSHVAGKGDEEKKMVENPQDILVLVNKEYNLPADYVPPDLVQPDIPFSFSEDLPKKKMRQETARALEDLIRQAAADGIELVGVSGYRSYQHQEAIFTARARERGEEVANRTSARPGQSEHQTGLAMDVSCRSVGYGLIEEFGSTEEGIWLAEHAPEFGFIIRYPKGKEHLTGYSYEPWHIRYVGVEAAREIADRGLILEEYLAGKQPQNDKLVLDSGEGLAGEE
ncbi:MAG: M15 family metallopeptidase [bacterium]|jgi:D-alanyl-D-alanine carboxypeptidase